MTSALSSPAPSTLQTRLDRLAERFPDRPALLGLGRPPCSFDRLAGHVREVGAALAGFGLGPGDRVAVVLPNGPEMAVAFLAVGTWTTCAPLNPNYRTPEFEFYLADLQARALIVAHDLDSDARGVARSLGIPVLDLTPRADDPAGLFDLAGPAADATHVPRSVAPEDVALVLHTSGTTSRPKQVPLSHRNLCTSSATIARGLALTPDDRCLNVMPLFHIHGLMAALLASLTAGGSTACTPGFYAPEFFGWIDAFRPTWYTAVPTMHQAILARAAGHRTVVERTPLRFVRSSSASLPPQVMAALEETFSAPVIEAYGMTEASHQMTTNPLPPAPRKPGSVGLPAGPEVAIMDEAGTLLPQGALGEVVIRGPSVTTGYVRNDEANARAFTDGWFRTGDQGYLDPDGYLFLTGRLKEIINRGGEKISPREVDEVLLGHPDVVQAVTFAVPDPALGEDVAAAVILRDGADVSSAALRRFAAARLADFKVPRHVLFLDEVPKGPTGKLQRIGLADRLGLNEPPESAPEPALYTPPESPLETTLAALWSDVLKIDRIGTHDRFLQLGGDSMLATRLVNRIRTHFGIELTLLDFFDAPTVAEQALVVEEILLDEIESEGP